MLYILYYTLLFLSIWKTAYAPYIPDEKYFEWVRQKEEIEQGKSYYESQRKHICLDCMIACMSMNEDLLNDPAWANKLDDLKENMEIAQNLGPERVNPLIDLISDLKSKGERSCPDMCTKILQNALRNTWRKQRAFHRADLQRDVEANRLSSTAIDEGEEYMKSIWDLIPRLTCKDNDNPSRPGKRPPRSDQAGLTLPSDSPRQGSKPKRRSIWERIFGGNKETKNADRERARAEDDSSRKKEEARQPVEGGINRIVKEKPISLKASTAQSIPAARNPSVQSATSKDSGPDGLSPEGQFLVCVTGSAVDNLNNLHQHQPKLDTKSLSRTLGTLALSKCSSNHAEGHASLVALLSRAPNLEAKRKALQALVINMSRTHARLVLELSKLLPQLVEFGAKAAVTVWSVAPFLLGLLWFAITGQEGVLA